jgi:hypothetical protein
MENQYVRHECGPGEDSCECSCHPAARSCPGCEPIHGGGGRSMNPTQMLVPMWYKAFFTAQSELMAEKIKKKIETAYGPTMDKLAEAFMESMGKQWQAMVQKASANQEFQEKLTRILGEASQQQKQQQQKQK